MKPSEKSMKAAEICARKWWYVQLDDQNQFHRMQEMIALALDAAADEEREACAVTCEKSCRRHPIPADPHDDSDMDKNLRIIYVMIDQAAEKIRARSAKVEEASHAQ